ncbi:hypothetical protein INT43_007415 [Umbelopsis isabellina]|uniref:MSP domain-containing protein n=1 Tax=Mortierella isabellina TaxID=91625 RepID=A0A8H7PZ08_MORIS|nr:hypothetical protein INT43_007415 [Umbelopsis isabellina]
MTSDSIAAFSRYRRYCIDIRFMKEQIQLMNPTHDYMAFCLTALNDQCWNITPCSGIIAPLTSANITITIKYNKSSSTRGQQFKLKWIEVKRNGLIASYIHKNKSQLCKSDPPINLLSILLAQDFQDESVIQERLIHANISASMKAQYRQSVPKYQLKAVPQLTSNGQKRIAALPITFSSPNQTNSNVSLLSLRNISQDSVMLFRILVYGKQRTMFSVSNSWGMIEPKQEKNIYFKAHPVTAALGQNGYFKMLWCLIPVKGEMLNYMQANVPNDRHQLQRLQNHFPDLKVYNAMLQASARTDQVLPNPDTSPISPSGKLVLKCVMGKSLGIYQKQ